MTVTNFFLQSEAYWRQQAKMLGHEHEVAEAEIHKMIRDRQRDCDTLREKEQSEQKLREEIDFLQKVRRGQNDTLILHCCMHGHARHPASHRQPHDPYTSSVFAMHIELPALDLVLIV